jgi:L-methionine (R)-S-oxide reductase
MAETLDIAQSTDKAARYKTLLPQIDSLISGEPDLIANLSNIAAALKQTFNFFWVGFYIVTPRPPKGGNTPRPRKGENAPPSGAGGLVLGPFQGPIACTRISFGKGVCGSAWKEKKTIIVPDVDLFPGHIACSSASKSEIVVPVFSGDEVAMVLDVDSDQLNAFDEIDKLFLEELVAKIVFKK